MALVMGGKVNDLAEALELKPVRGMNKGGKHCEKQLLEPGSVRKDLLPCL